MVVAYFLLSLLVSCSFSFKTEAYEQQYNVGDTGPNGGTVTSVTLESILSDSVTELVGDFLETTDTYTYTETIVEEIEQTTYETVQVTQEVTTNNLLNTYTDTNINIVGNDYGMTGAEITTGNQSQGGGSRVYDIDVSDYDDIQEIDYGSTVYSHSSNSSVPLCANTTSDCKDEFKITVSLYNNGVLVKNYTHNYYNINWTGSQDYSYNQDVSSLTFNTAELELYGMDAGYTTGYYGPGFSDMFFTATYNQIANVINTIINTIEQTTIKQTDEYVYSSEYIPPVEEVYTDFIIDVSFEMDFQTSEPEMISFEFEVVEDTAGEIDIQMTTFEDEMQVDFEVVELEMPEVSEEIEVEIDVAQEEPDSEPTQESDMETEEEGEQEAVQEKPTKEQVAQKIMARVVEAGNQTVLNNVKLAVMAQLTDTAGFDAYQSKTLQDAELYISEIPYDSQQLADPYAQPYNMAQDYLMGEIVNSQYGTN